jgi:hypothetical protein
MVERTLVESKIEASKGLAGKLAEKNLPLLAAYWDWSEDKDRWTFYLVPRSNTDERKLVNEASEYLVGKPYRSVFSLLDVIVDSQQIGRAKALAAYIRNQGDLGKQFDSTFTGGQFFESVIPVFIASDLASNKVA